jgi:hypothetical protein
VINGGYRQTPTCFRYRDRVLLILHLIKVVDNLPGDKILRQALPRQLPGQLTSSGLSAAIDKFGRYTGAGQFINVKYRKYPACLKANHLFFIELTTNWQIKNIDPIQAISGEEARHFHNKTERRSRLAPCAAMHADRHPEPVEGSTAAGTRCTFPASFKKHNQWFSFFILPTFQGLEARRTRQGAILSALDPSTGSG